jgi:hypothetical protein
MLAQVPGQGGVVYSGSTPPAGGTQITPITDANNCPEYSCVNNTGQGYYGALDTQCQAQNKIPPPMMIGGIAAAALLLLLPGWSKILALPVAAYGVVASFTMISQGQPDGTCKWVSQGL